MGLLHPSRRLQRSMKRGCPCWLSAEETVSQVTACETPSAGVIAIEMITDPPLPDKPGRTATPRPNGQRARR